MAIEKLNNSAAEDDGVLDMTKPPREESQPAVTTKKKLSMNDIVGDETGEIDMTANTVQKQKASKIRVSTSGGSRQTVSIHDIVQEEPEKHGNPNISQVHKEGESILDLDDPESPFNQYLAEKQNEYQARMAIEEERVREAVAEGELDENSEIAKSWLGDPEEKKDAVKVRTNEIVFDDDEDDIEEVTEKENETVENHTIIDEFAFEEVEDTEAAQAEEDTTLDLAEEEDDTTETEKPEEVVAAPEGVDFEDDSEEDELNSLLHDEDDLELEESNDNSNEIEEVVKLDDVDVSISNKKSTIVDEEEETTDDSNNDEEVVDKLRRLATERLKPKKSIIDISKFQVAKAEVTNINPLISTRENKVAKWVLINQGQIVLMREFSGVELQTFVENSNTNSITSFARKMRLIYNHIESPKPDTFEGWLKTTPYADLDHYYFGVYVASFNGANYIPVDCSGGTKCKEGTFISEDVAVMDMVKFKDNEAKKKFKTIYKEEPTNVNPQGKYIYNLVPINDTFAIGFREPMLYDYMEALNADESFSSKYSSVVNLAPYIDKFYVIDQANGVVRPISYNTYTGNAAKTYRSKIRKYNTLLSYLNPDEYSMVEAYATDIMDRKDGISYKIPALTCPYCGTESSETETTAQELVFTRYQLGALVSTSLK